MARISVEDCLENVENRFALVHIAAKRSKDLYKGASPLIHCKNREVVTSLREIAAGKIHYTDENGVAYEKPEKPIKKSKKS